jgi:hypothetical protein
VDTPVTLSLWADVLRPDQTRSDYLRREGDLYHRAAAAAVLVADGWAVDSFWSSVYATHPAVRTPAHARRRLAAVGTDQAFKVMTHPSPPPPPPPGGVAPRGQRAARRHSRDGSKGGVTAAGSKSISQARP